MQFSFEGLKNVNWDALRAMSEAGLTPDDIRGLSDFEEMDPEEFEVYGGSPDGDPGERFGNRRKQEHPDAKSVERRFETVEPPSVTRHAAGASESERPLPVLSPHQIEYLRRQRVGGVGVLEPPSATRHNDPASSSEPPDRGGGARAGHGGRRRSGVGQPKAGVESRTRRDLGPGGRELPGDRVKVESRTRRDLGPGGKELPGDRVKVESLTRKDLAGGSVGGRPSVDTDPPGTGTEPDPYSSPRVPGGSEEEPPSVTRHNDPASESAPVAVTEDGEAVYADGSTWQEVWGPVSYDRDPAALVKYWEDKWAEAGGSVSGKTDMSGKGGGGGLPGDGDDILALLLALSKNKAAGKYQSQVGGRV